LGGGGVDSEARFNMGHGDRSTVELAVLDHVTPPPADAPPPRTSAAPSRRPPGLRRTLVALALLGAAWFAGDVVTHDPPALTGDRFERIDRYVADQLDGSRIPGASVAIVEDGV